VLVHFRHKSAQLKVKRFLTIVITYIKSTWLKILQDLEKKHEDVFWINLREEPVTYVNGTPFSPRDVTLQ
jgi:hypothetical protein